jgi:hypothetical protein
MSWNVMDGVEAFQREISSKGYPYMPPLGEQFLDIAIAQLEAQVEPDRVLDGGPALKRCLGG